MNHNNETWSHHHDFVMNIFSWKLQHSQKRQRHNLQCYLIWIIWCFNFFSNIFIKMWVFHYKHMGTYCKRSNYIHKMLLNTRGTASIVFLVNWETLHYTRYIQAMMYFGGVLWVRWVWQRIRGCNWLQNARQHGRRNKTKNYSTSAQLLVYQVDRLICFISS